MTATRDYLTSDIKITEEQLIQAVLKYENSIMLNPTAIVDGALLPSCKYYQDGKRCLIGQVLSDLGVSDDTLRHFDAENRPAASLPVWANATAAHLAWDLQAEADQGFTWRDAIWHVQEMGGF